MFRKKNKEVHQCRLAVEDEDVDAGLPKSDPSAGACQRWLRNVRKLILVSFSNTQTHFYIRSKPALIAERRRQCRTCSCLVIHPLSVFALYRQVVMTVLWLTSAFVEPLVGAYDYPHIPVWAGIQLVFLVDIFINFLDGYIHEKTQEIVLDLRLIARRYLLSYFIFDLASTLVVPLTLTITDSWILRDDPNTELDVVGLCVGLSLLQTLFRVTRIAAAIGSITSAFRHMGFGHLSTTILGIMLKTLVVLHYAACVNFAISDYLAIRNNAAATFNMIADIYHDTVVSRRYVANLLQVCCLFFRSSQGVIGIDTTEELILQSILLVAGLFYFAYATVLVYDIVEVHSAVGNRFEVVLGQLDEYMVQRKVPLHLRKRAINYYNHRYERKYFRESLILDTLTEHLRYEIVLFTCMPMVKKAPFLSRLPRPLVGQLMAAFTREIFLHNDVVFKAGDVPRKMYFIYAGTVALYSPEGVEFFHYEDGENFGELCIMQGGARRCSAVAVETSEVFSLSSQDLRRCLRPYPQFWSGLKTSVEKRFNRARDEVAHLQRAGKRVDACDIKDTYEYL